MTSELSILMLYGLLVIATILIQVLLALPQVGLPYLASPRDEQRELPGTAGRAERALGNSVVAMALFAPAILVLHINGATGPASLLAAQVFLIARLIYLPVYLAGIPWLRTAVWMVGLLATAWLYLLAI
ncbi:hypothetical protein BV394_11100 [Brevirhabdus pacifica]|uniref:Uncharacterized protein n=1 Tax=Brevirhabdus pacifica TaxID=1267768 RepID=A0A1U7DJV3_9RHOB|nr:MAPEG family protein [Brevirhabdus pacifica]APX90205.1 hypothetical protein BV394_11100 [Brevirhabdus pacifica]OWU78742.1 membrane protein [Loktanella sp. 22II-4b]PJJ80637.1 putative MAPEG superfamily protein [Brevirhabdus pacifica]